MRKRIIIVSIIVVLIMSSTMVFAAYHHAGEVDSASFLKIYPKKAGTKLDHCALCHTGGTYEKREGNFVSLGSCQWCHYSYGYEGSGNITDTLNQYGKDYNNKGRNADAIKAIKNFDSDKDSFTNEIEIEANRFPGNNADDPDKKIAPYRIYTRDQLEAAFSPHTQFLLMNTSRSGDFYAEYTGVPIEDLLEDAGILESATGITVYAPDGWSQYHPLEKDETHEIYHIKGIYPSSSYYHKSGSEQWCDYDATSCIGRNPNDSIYVKEGLKLILAYKREGVNLDAGILTNDNKLDGEGPYRVVVPQKTPCPPDQSSKSDNQNVIWPYNFELDHNAGASTRSATIIKVEPLPEGTTDIDVLEAGWEYIDQEKIIIYGAIDENSGNSNNSYSSSNNDVESVSSSCFIATAAYGSYFEPQVKILRDMRDKFLLKTHVGKLFVEVYYKFSPPFANFISNQETLRFIVRCGLTPIVGLSWIALNFGAFTALFIVVIALLTLTLGFKRIVKL